MSRFDVYRNQGKSAATRPYLVDVQSNLLDELSTRVVIPLGQVGPHIRRQNALTPTFDIEGQTYALEPQNLAAIPVKELKQKVTSLAAHQGAIVSAIDFLFSGY